MGLAPVQLPVAPYRVQFLVGDPSHPLHRVLEELRCQALQAGADAVAGEVVVAAGGEGAEEGRAGRAGGS